MTSGLDGEALALCRFCKYRAELDEQIKTNEFLIRRNQRLWQALVTEREFNGKYPVNVYLEGDLVERGQAW